ncbi:MAG: ROK family protein [Candidatus Pacearchaeota archaeon]
MGDKIIAIDLGGTNLRVALVEDNKVKEYIKSPTPKEKEELLYVMCKNISKLFSKDVRGIGVASAGPLEKGIILNPPNLPFKNFNLKKYLKKKFKTRVEVANDADCVAIAESKLGCKKNNFFILTIGTDIGGGIIVDSELFNGRGLGGELGHIILDNGKRFGVLAAGKRLKKLTKEKFGKELLINDLIKIKDKKAKEILEELSEYLGQGIASLINVFDPEIVVLSGGVKESGKNYLKMIQESTKKYVATNRKVKIVWSKLEHPGILGASLLID